GWSGGAPAAAVSAGRSMRQLAPYRSRSCASIGKAVSGGEDEGPTPLARERRPSRGRRRIGFARRDAGVKPRAAKSETQGGRGIGYARGPTGTGGDVVSRTGRPRGSLVGAFSGGSSAVR